MLLLKISCFFCQISLYLNRSWCIFWISASLIGRPFLNKNCLQKKGMQPLVVFFFSICQVFQNLVYFYSNILWQIRKIPNFDSSFSSLVRCKERKILWFVARHCGLVSSWKVLKTTKKLPSVKRTPMFPPRQVLSHKGMTLFSRINVLETNSLHKTIWYTWLFIRECFSVGSWGVSLH